VALALVLGFVSLTQAAPLDLKQVPADAKWVVHIDIDAVKATTIVQNAWKMCNEKHPEAAQHMDKAKQMIGMDPRKDLHGVTMYGKQIGKPEGVMIVNVQVDQKLLAEKAEKAPDHKVVKHGDAAIHTWTVKHGKQQRPAAGAFYKDGIVFAGSVDEVKAALDLLAGKGASAGTASPLAGPVLPGTTVLVRVSGIAAANLPVKSPIVKQIEAVRIAMGENNGQSFFRGKATMTNAEVVNQVKTIIEGGKAMASLRVAKDEQIKKMVDAVKITPEGKTLTVSWSAPASEVWAVAQKVAKEIKKHHDQMGPKGPAHHKDGKKGAKKDGKKGDAKKGCPPNCPGCPKCKKAPSAEKKHAEEF